MFHLRSDETFSWSLVAPAPGVVRGDIWDKQQLVAAFVQILELCHQDSEGIKKHNKIIRYVCLVLLSAMNLWIRSVV